MEMYRAHVLVCHGTNCSLKAPAAIIKAFARALGEHGLEREVRVVETGCFGLCEQGPTVVIYPEGTLYTRVESTDVAEIVREHLLKGRPVERLRYTAPVPQKKVEAFAEADHFRRQQRIVLRNCGVIDPDVAEEYIARGGYTALGKVLTEMKPAEVVATVREAGLRGRGGAGFPTGLKWQFAAGAAATPKYVVCNADEGEPGTFKDRLILEGDPHAVLEAMAICGYAIGAELGYIYVRGEYTLSIKRLEQAIVKARELGLLGQNILGSGFGFEVEVRVGAGAYVCGEETALFESLAGGRGEPRLKPPYPTDFGVFGQPTVINNVETLANLPPIINNGAAWYKGIGTEKTPGTKVFTLCGDIVNGGLIEVPMGMTLREVIYDIGGGIPGGRGFKLAQTGGTSGGCIVADQLDVPMDYDSLAAAGTALGSGALLIIDDTHCIVDIAGSFAKFFVHESCGKCVPCREGTKCIYDIVAGIAAGTGSMADLALLERLARVMYKAPLCALGQTAPLPIMTTLDHFRDEYVAHIQDKACPAGVCQKLARQAKGA